MHSIIIVIIIIIYLSSSAGQEGKNEPDKKERELPKVAGI